MVNSFYQVVVMKKDSWFVVDIDIGIVFVCVSRMIVMLMINGIVFLMYFRLKFCVEMIFICFFEVMLMRKVL